MIATTPEISHAEANAKAWSETIAAAYEAHRFCTEGGEGRDLSWDAKDFLHDLGYDGLNLNDVAEEIERQMRDIALSVSVRSQWQTPGFHPLPGDFQILISTGGPALRVLGELDENSRPSRFWIEHQDWGTPWTLWPHAEAYALDWFCGLFWFGD